jgi:ABC-type transport system involved in multi-copper enzyme maturation permease subunit
MKRLRLIAMIALNFVREQRWPILVLQLSVLGLAALGLLSDTRSDRDDILLTFKQLGMYGVAFSIFFGGSAIYNERRSRRILAVLGKAITRRDYLSGLLLGVALASVLFSLMLGFTGTWTLCSIGFSFFYLWYLMGCVVAACVLSAAVALFFSTHLNPWMSAMFTGLTLGVPGVLAFQFGGVWQYILPLYSLMRVFLKASYEHPGMSAGWAIQAALLETVILWLAASWVFARIDVAVAVD